MHFKGLHGRQNIENLWSPTLIVITGLILPGNYGCNIWTERHKKQKFKYSMCQSGKK